MVPHCLETTAADRILQKIGVWLRTKYGGSINKKSGKNNSFKQLFDKPELEPPAPTRPRVIHFYSRRYYEARIKSRFEARWAAASKLSKPPAQITVHNVVTREAWAAETEPFKLEVEAALEAEHKAAREAYDTAISGEAPTTPEEYQV